MKVAYDQPAVAVPVGAGSGCRVEPRRPGLCRDGGGKPDRVPDPLRRPDQLPGRDRTLDRRGRRPHLLHRPDRRPAFGPEHPLGGHLRPFRRTSPGAAALPAWRGRRQRPGTDLHPAGLLVLPGPYAARTGDLGRPRPPVCDRRHRKPHDGALHRSGRPWHLGVVGHHGRGHPGRDDGAGHLPLSAPWQPGGSRQGRRHDTVRADRGGPAAPPRRIAHRTRRHHQRRSSPHEPHGLVSAEERRWPNADQATCVVPA